MTHAVILRPQTMDELMRFAAMAAKSSMVPSAFKGRPEDIVLAVQMGSELGLPPMQALQNIAVINSRPALWGDAMLALCKQHPAWIGIREAIEGVGDGMMAVCEVSRNGEPVVTSRFSVEDAKRAKLWGKSGPWETYPRRMLQMRARGFALRDAFPDALRGLVSAEEVADLAESSFAGTTIDACAEPPAESCADQPTLDTARNPRDFLAALQTLLDRATTEEAVDEILAHPRVQSAQTTFAGIPRDILTTMISAARERVAPARDWTNQERPE